MSARGPIPPDPLDREERELAERLSKLAGGAPSAALDARVLAMAREATATRTPTPSRARRGRWLPAGLVTALGTAAAFVAVVGVVWQLRPQAPHVRGHTGEADGGVVVAEMVKPRRPVLVAPAPPPVPEAPAAEAGPERAAAPARAPAAARDARVAAAPVQADVPHQIADVDEWQARDAAAEPALHARAQVATTSANEAAAATAAPAPAAAAAKSTMPDAAAADAAAPQVLDRIAITGARIGLPPVREDTRLEPADWLQRIRDRRDQGDLAGARASLERFRRSHPRVRLPDDLRRLPR